jgi:hypothetical protein
MIYCLFGCNFPGILSCLITGVHITVVFREIAARHIYPDFMSLEKHLAGCFHVDNVFVYLTGFDEFFLQE